MAGALQGLAIRHGVPEVGVPVGPFYTGEAATLELPREGGWRKLHRFLSDAADAVVGETTPFALHSFVGLRRTSAVQKLSMFRLRNLALLWLGRKVWEIARPTAKRPLRKRNRADS